MTGTAEVIERRARQRLARHGQRLVKPRPGRVADEYGPYYTVDIATNGITRYGITLEQLVEVGRS